MQMEVLFRAERMYISSCTVAVLVIIIAATALIYARSLQNGILNWDDQAHIINNPDIQSLSLHNLTTIFTSYYVSMYQPLTTLSFAIEYHFFGLQPAAYHATKRHCFTLRMSCWFSSSCSPCPSAGKLPSSQPASSACTPCMWNPSPGLPSAKMWCMLSFTSLRSCGTPPPAQSPRQAP